MLEYRYDTQLLIDGDDLDEDEVAEYFTENFKGDCLLAVGGDGDPIKIHYHTNEPWKVLEYCRSLGEIYDIVVEDMDRQSRGLKADRKVKKKACEKTKVFHTPFFIYALPCLGSGMRSAMRSRISPPANRKARVPTPMLTLPVSFVVRPMSMVPTNAAPLPQMSYNPKYSPLVSGGMILA